MKSERRTFSGILGRHALGRDAEHSGGYPFGMRNLAFVILLVAAAFGSTPTLAADRCKSSYSTERLATVFTNIDLDQAGERGYDTDCADLYVRILESEMLPERNGIRMPAMIVYELRNDALFPMIRRFLDAARGGSLALEIKFSIGEDDEPGELTRFEVRAADRPPPLR